MLEHKFLVFVCNPSDTHWVSVVVINPFLIFEKYLAESNNKESRIPVDLCEEDFAG
jgi:flagellar assembly factor FliW